MLNLTHFATDMTKINWVIVAGSFIVSTLIFSPPAFSTMNPEDLPDGSVYIEKPSPSAQMKSVSRKTVPAAQSINKGRLLTACPKGYIWYAKGGYCTSKFD